MHKIAHLPKTAKIFRKSRTYKWSQKLHEKHFFLPKIKQILLQIRLSIRVSPKYFLKSFILTPKSPFHLEALWCKNHENPSDRQSHTWAPLLRYKYDGGGPPGFSSIYLLSIKEGKAESKSPQKKFGYFLSISQQAISADIIPNLAVGIFSQKEKEQKHNQLGYTDKLVTKQI
jgi:hypothetical protein